MQRHRILYSLLGGGSVNVRGPVKNGALEITQGCRCKEADHPRDDRLFLGPPWDNADGAVTMEAI